MSVSPSRLSKVETEKQIKKLCSDILNKISVTLEAFNPDYYKEDLKTFIICGIASNVKNFVILAPSYRIQMNLKYFYQRVRVDILIDHIIEYASRNFNQCYFGSYGFLMSYTRKGQPYPK